MKIVRMLSVSIIAMLVLSAMTVLPVFSGGTPRTYPGGGGVGQATMYVSPQDSLFTSTTPIDSRIGDTFTVDVRIGNATNIASWQVELSYNKNYLTATSANYAADMIFPAGMYPAIPASIGVENATHDYVLMTATTYGTVEYDSGVWPASKGLITVLFTIIADPPAGIGNKLWTSLYIEHSTTGVFGSYTGDATLSDNPLTIIDGYYENAYVPPPPAYLEISPAVTNMPAIDGDRIVGTPDSFFDVYIMINDVDPVDELFFVQLNLTWDPALINVFDLDEGTFMNDAAWAPHGTMDDSWMPDLAGFGTWWIMILPNDTGYWDNTAWPSGDGILAIVHCEVVSQNADADGVAPAGLTGTSALDLSGVFGEFYLGHPNDPDPPYLPYGEPTDGVVNIYDYYWAPPVAIKTHDPETPLVDEIATFDGSASYGYRNVDGVMTPDPTYIVSYEWDFGDTFTGSGAIVTHAYTAMGIYTVTLNVTDEDGRWDIVSQEVEVIFGRLIDVFIGTGTGAYPAPYGGQGQNKVADMFEPQKTVCVYVLVTYNGDPVQSKLVTFIILSPSGLHDFSRTAITNGTGYAYIEFGLPWPCVDPVAEIFGIWSITVKVDIRSIVVEDTVWFKVWWLIEVTEVVPKATRFVKGGFACFDIYFRTYRMQPIDTVLEITLYDDLDVPFAATRVQLEGIGWGDYIWCEFKYYHIELCLEIPKWAFVGDGKAYVNAFHVDCTNPYNMGSPYCPEAVAYFKIDKAPVP